MMGATDQERIPINAKFIYNKPADYNTPYVNGVIGGTTPRGEIILNFFFEYSDVPKEEEDELINGRLVPKKFVTDAPREVQRDIKACIIMSPEHAKGIAEFINDLADQLLKQTNDAPDHMEDKDAQ